MIECNIDRLSTINKLKHITCCACGVFFIRKTSRLYQGSYWYWTLASGLCWTKTLNRCRRGSFVWKWPPWFRRLIFWLWWRGSAVWDRVSPCHKSTPGSTKLSRLEVSSTRESLVRRCLNMVHLFKHGSLTGLVRDSIFTSRFWIKSTGTMLHGLYYLTY